VLNSKHSNNINLVVWAIVATCVLKMTLNPNRPSILMEDSYIFYWIHPIQLVFGSRVEFSGSADRMLLPVRSNPRWRPAAILENFQMAIISATGHPIDFLFGFRVGFSRWAHRMARFPV